MSTFEYIGEELDVFALAVNWKHYWASKIEVFLGQSVLEVGAGIGGTTRLLVEKQREAWVALEPDHTMWAQLVKRKQAGEFPTWCTFRHGTVTSLAYEEAFDTIMYIDVLEHIEDDAGELERAAAHLNDNGHLIVLSPAYPILYTEFDEAIGHYRRYTRHSLLALTPPQLQVEKTFYLDSVGLFLSLANKLLLHSSKPTAEQITFWDRTIVPVSRLIDSLHGFSAGRSIVAIWKNVG